MPEIRIEELEFETHELPGKGSEEAVAFAEAIFAELLVRRWLAGMEPNESPGKRLTSPPNEVRYPPPKRAKGGE